VAEIAAVDVVNASGLESRIAVNAGGTMAWYLVVLEYLKTLITWPVAAVAIVFILRRSLAALIERIVSVRVPGIQLATAQQTEPPPKPLPETPAPKLPENLNLTPAEQEILKKLIQADRAAARLWEYRYLNFFLAPQTQVVLQWLNEVQTTSDNACDAYWLPHIPDETQRSNILRVLMAHHLIEYIAPILRITEKGKEYVAWRGPLFPASVPQPNA
jgi:hypothetical protein